MALYPVETAHHSLSALKPVDRYSFYELADETGTYAVGAIARHEDCLELHLEVLRFGPATVRALRTDVGALKTLAKSLGMSRIAAVRVEAGPLPDLRWPKFTRLFGFTNQRLYQAAELLVE